MGTLKSVESRCGCSFNKGSNEGRMEHAGHGISCQNKWARISSGYFSYFRHNDNSGANDSRSSLNTYLCAEQPVTNEKVLISFSPSYCKYN